MKHLRKQLCHVVKSVGLGAVFGSALMAQSIAIAAPASGSDANEAALSNAQLMSKLYWRSVGPYIGGRVVAVAGVPQKPHLFYMGAVDGGVWKSNDDGLTWKNISDKSMHTANISIGAIAVAQSNPKVLYVGTGEHDIRGDLVTGNGVYKSTDGGKHWKYVGLKKTHTISNIVVDPDSPKIVYVAALGHVFAPNAERGIYKSVDGGKHWKKILYVNKKTGAINLVMDPHHPDTLYAAMWQAYRAPGHLSSGGPGSGLYKSTDGGQHWINLSRKRGLPHGVLGRIGMAVARSKSGVVYTIIQAKRGGIFRSSDGGQSWKRVNNDMKLRQRAFYYMNISVDPKDANTVYVSEVEALFVSHNGGKKFKKLKTPHGDNHIVWINPDHPDTMLEGNDGGATVTVNGGKTWSPEHNQPTGQFYHVNLDNRFPYHIYGAQQDNAPREGPSATASHYIPLRAWQRVAGGESTFTVPQPGKPWITYGSGYYSIFSRYNRQNEQRHDLSPWPYYRSGASSRELKYRFGWTHPILFSPNNPQELLVGAQSVLKSMDYGRSWSRISPDLTRNDKYTERPSGGRIDLDQSGAEIYPIVNTLAVSPLDDNLIWAGSDDGLVHVTTSDGKHWRNVTPKGLPKWSKISSIEPSHTRKGTAYMAVRRYMWDDFKPYVFKTMDYGRHWSRITNGLPEKQYVFTIRQDPRDPDLLFLTTKNTIYVSLNRGQKWLPFGLNLPHVQVRDIAIQLRQNQAVIATHGRGFWVLDNLALLRELTKNPSVKGASPYLFGPQQAWLTKSYGVQKKYKPDNAGQNPPFGTTVFFHMPSNYTGHAAAKLTFTDAQGHVVRSFKLHLKKKKKKKKQQKSENEQNTRGTNHKKNAKHSIAVKPGMNRYQWDLRYPDAVQVKAFHPSEVTSGVSSALRGPEVVPGKYYTVLKYRGQTIRKPLQVVLDPRLSTPQHDLKIRYQLLMQIHHSLNRLDSVLNKVIPLRKKLRKAIKKGNLSGPDARNVLTALNRNIGETVQLKIHSNEGDLVHEIKLHSELGALASRVEDAYAEPTKAEHKVFNVMQNEARKYEARLQVAIKRESNLLNQTR